MAKILVVNDLGNSYAKAVAGLAEICDDVADFVRNPENYDMLLFTGGADITPKLYGDTSPSGLCNTNERRDALEFALAKRAMEAGVIMAGICRGFQLLNVFSGGRMIHHLERHAGTMHDTVIEALGRSIRTNSLHHQMAILPTSGYLVAHCSKSLSPVYIGRDDLEEEIYVPETEAAIFPSTKSFGVQWHPEMMNPKEE